MKFNCPRCKGKGKIDYSLDDINKPIPSVIMKLFASSINLETIPKEWLEDSTIQEIKKFKEMNNENKSNNRHQR